MCVFFFFFQAEDGIRDLTVTGVQTCALPICGYAQTMRTFASSTKRCGSAWPPGVRTRQGERSDSTVAVSVVGHLSGPLKICRSEERRVGKECRSRWSPYH